MHRIARLAPIALSLFAFALQAQIPAQPGTNPNTVPPPNPGTRPFNRPTAATRPGGLPTPNNAPRPTPPAGRPGGAPGPNAPGGDGANGDAKPAMKPEDAIKEDGGVELQFPNTPLSQILLVYEDLTGLKIIRDANAEQATVSIETTGELPKDKAIMFIEKSLLLNGYSFVPAGEGMVKLLAFDAKKPQTEGAPLIESAMELPITDQVVSFVVLLKYLSGEDAIKAIDQVIPRHSYGVLTPVPNTKALVITENSNTIRSILALLERLDTKPAETQSKTFTLTRSDAEDVKKALDEILGTDDKNASGGNGRTPNIPQNTPGGVPAPVVQQSIPLNPIAGGSNSSSSAETVPPKIHAITRRNCLLVIATPETMEYIGKLIEELDAASELRNFVSRSLTYLSVESAMSIIGDAISRTEGDGEGGGGASGGTGTNGQNQNQANQNNQNRNNNSSSLFGNNNSNSFGSNSGFGSSSGGLGGSSGIGGGGGNLTPLRQNNGPTSMLVGKTLLISDPIANTVFASGPPEHLRILNEIIDELDKRPQQIIISALIGSYQTTTGKGFNLETAFRGARNNRGLFGQAGVSGGLSSSTTSNGTTTTTTLDPRNLVSAATAFSSGNGLSFIGGLGDGIDIIFQSLESDTDFKVLARPTIFTMNNTPATLTSGQSFPIASSTQSSLVGGSANNSFLSNVQYQDIVLSLNIIPLINSPDELTLQISQQNSENAGSTTVSGNDYPIISKQEINTVIACKNRSTVLLGGLIRNDNNSTHNGVPLLSSIPLLKKILGSRRRETSQRELLIFIEPRIVEGMHDLPPSIHDSIGSSPFGNEAKAGFYSEKTIAEKEKALKAMPVEKKSATTRIKEMVNKLFE